jgi:outer membrane protein insertion porin family
VNVDVQQPRDPNLADLIFSVKEGKPGVLSAGAGFSSVDRFVGTFQIQHTNLFGRAQRLDLSYEFGARRQNLEIGWTDPWFLGYNMSGGVDLFNTVRVRDFPGVRNSFREKRRGVGTRLGPRIGDNLSLLFSYTIQTTEIFDVDANIKQDLFPTFGIPKENALGTDSISQIKSSFLSELAYDTRDNQFDASRGMRDSVSVETAGGPLGGDINYYKPQVTSAIYFPTFWKFVFSVSGRAAWVNSFAPSNDVPSSERFFLGGPDTVRGYSNNSIVPRVFERNLDGGQEIRQIPGRIMTLFNAEYKFPIVQEHNRTIFQGAFFIDAGQTWLRTQDISLQTGRTDNRLKVGAGFGFRFKTPVFPIRLDFAIPLTPRNTDTSRQGDSRGFQPYFTIGNIF